MKIQINIEKRHFFVLMFVFAALAGIVLVIAQTPPTPNPGHSVAEVPGATPNCLTSTTEPACTTAIGPGSGWNPSLTAIRAAAAKTAETAGNADALGGVAASNYCRSDGSNCGFATTNCPSGMTRVGDYCIDTFARPSSFTWVGAVDDCKNAGMRLCSGVEWTSACLVLGPTNWIVGGNGNWAGDSVGNNIAMEYGISGSCTSAGSQSYGSNERYRCCKNLV